MVDTIGPMVRAETAKRRRVEWAHAAGGAFGGATSGFFLAAAGAVVGFDEAGTAWGLGALAALALILLVVDWSHDGRRLGLARQTPRAWAHVLSRGTAAFLNGFDLGLGWSTRIYFTSYVLAMLAALVTAHALVGAAIGACFGAARAVFVVLAQRHSQGVLSIDFLATRRPVARALNAAALLQFALVGGVTAAGMA